MSAQREYDIVLFGATGFTGELTARYLAEHAPPGCRWALAGRNLSKLEQVRGRLAERVDPACAELALVRADAGDEVALREIADSARVVITTVGPYLRYGEPLVAACAAAGTDYVDLTGEAEFADLMYLNHHETATRTGARLVHACGFDSVPYDLGVYNTVKALPEGVPIEVNSYFTASWRPSGGTAQTVVNSLGRMGGMVRAAAKRRERETTAGQRPAGRRIRGAPGRPRFEPDVGGWVLPAPTIDPQIVLRSARALERYGPDFAYGHYLALRRLRTAAAVIGGMTAVAALAQLPPTRRWLEGRVKPGAGPSEERMARSWFRARFVGSGGGQRVVTQLSGGDPGYAETAKIIAEAALCLAFDDLPSTSGQVTSAVAMGDALTERLAAAGLAFRVLRRS